MSTENKKAHSALELIEILWKEGMFKAWLKLNQVIKILGDRGLNISKPEIAISLKRAKFLTRRGKRGSFEYIQKMPAINKEIDRIEEDLFSDHLMAKIKKDFSSELSDLKWNFGKSGTCTAFLLRKMLEKMIILTFAKNNLEAKLKGSTGKSLGLEAMINLSSSEKVSGIPFLTPSTAASIKGIKFLGDTSAHNPLINVDMKTIIPQMPFIITAYDELSKKL